MWPWSVKGAKPTKRHQTHYWSIIGPKLLVGIFTDQQYCTYNVQYCWCLICTNNIAPSPCKMFAPWRCKMLLNLWFWEGQLAVGCWQLAVGCWQLAAGSWQLFRQFNLTPILGYQNTGGVISLINHHPHTPSTLLANKGSGRLWDL